MADGATVVLKWTCVLCNYMSPCLFAFGLGGAPANGGNAGSWPAPPIWPGTESPRRSQCSAWKSARFSPEKEKKAGAWASRHGAGLGS
jgi:hypothetical protein